MKPRSYSSEAVVLARRNYSEADRILVLYTKDYGKVSVIAKGVRKVKSRKRGHLEIFTRLKFQATSGRGLDLITEAEIIDNFEKARKSLKKVSVAYYFMEVVGRITHDHEANRQLFDLILEFLKKLEIENRLKDLRLDFVLRLLTLLGYWPKGKILVNPEAKLEEVIERSLNSQRVGKRLVS